MSDRLRKAIEAFTAESNGPNPSKHEQSLAVLLNDLIAHDDARKSGGPSPEWLRTMDRVAAYLTALAADTQELREAWEETQKGA